MRILVCGAGATGMHVARVLAEVHHVTMIESAPERLPSGEDAFSVMLGDAADPGVLARAEAADTDVLIAATGHDQTNLIIARLAKQLGIRWVVARMNDPEHDWLFIPEAGVDIAVSTGALVARLVQEEVTAGDLVTLLRLRGPGVAVTETALPPGAAVAGLPAGELELPSGTVLTAVVREGHILIPERAGPLVAGDVVVALCEPGREHLLHQLLTGGVAD
ncbi:MAG TPA: TrkA family potassium uptake protein [Streptosporangiaceae bacterium]|nr:TrkA family potassium uptake protein [Streptosporangiaceae bacterium]